MNSKVIAAIAAVIILVCAGAGIALAQNNGGNGEQEHTMTVKNSLGEDVTVTLPLKSICVVNSNAAEFLQIVGTADRVKAVDSAIKTDLSDIYGNAANVGSYKTPDKDVILSSGCKLVISQSSSRSLSADTEAALKESGITVLRLDCYGTTMFDDVATLVKILESSSCSQKFDEYKTAYNTVKSAVLSKSASLGDSASYLLYFTSNKAFYNEKSELNGVVSSVGGHNCLTDIVAPGSGVSNKPAAESLYDYMKTNSVDYVIIRGTTGTTAQSSYDGYLSYGGTYDLSDCTAGQNKHIYVVHTDVLSGPRDYIGYVCIAEIFGIDTGYDYDQMVKDFNTKYGFSATYSYIISAFPA